MNAATPHAADSGSFATAVIERSKQTLVLVDFWAEWCGPCKAVAPVLDELAANYSGQLDVVKVDVDANRECAAEYAIAGIPTVVLFKDGAEVAREVGALPLEQYEALIQPHLS